MGYLTSFPEPWIGQTSDNATRRRSIISNGQPWVSRQISLLADPSNRRLAITLEINGLSAQQIASVRDATHFGWSPEAKDLYDQRVERIIALRIELFHLEQAS